ncbi:MAG: glycoside hydrolase family 25 protein [Niabella sp.]|nr:glycoside hydrolase family 25 protein [Niabella sp.]
MATKRKRKKSRKRLSPDQWRLLLALFALALLLGVFIMLDWSRKFDVEVKRYPQFGIDIPVAYSIHGIDVSRYQQTVLWPEVKAMRVDSLKIGFAFIKATEGEDDSDEQFKRNWRGARLARVVRGPYHYFIPSKDARKQAANFIKSVALAPGDLPPVLDVEQANNLTPDQIRAGVKIWLQLVEQHYKIRPMLYTNPEFYEKYLGKDFDGYPLWVAHYFEKRKPKIKRDWLIWQHNNAGRVNGIATAVDFNVFNGDSAAFRSILVK